MEHLLMDNLDFSRVSPNVEAAYPYKSRSVAKVWSKARILAEPGIFLGETMLGKFRGTTRKDRRLDRLEMPRSNAVCRTSPPLRQAEEGAGWATEPLVRPMTDCKLYSSSRETLGIEYMTTDTVKTTGIGILCKAVTTMIKLKIRLSKHQLGFEAVDSKVIADVLWEARAQVRAEHVTVWISNSLQLGWPVTEVSKFLSARSACDYINARYDWLGPICTDTSFQPSSHSRNPMLAQPSMFEGMIEATERRKAHEPDQSRNGQQSGGLWRTPPLWIHRGRTCQHGFEHRSWIQLPLPDGSIRS